MNTTWDCVCKQFLLKKHLLFWVQPCTQKENQAEMAEVFGISWKNSELRFSRHQGSVFKLYKKKSG
jgi:hypothetical protein